MSLNDLQKAADAYTPAPQDLDGIVLPDSLLALTEAVAENTHEVWAQGRLREGWTYGPERDDASKKTPCLLPYSLLPEHEKEFDRATALNAIRLIVKLGYRIEK